MSVVADGLENFRCPECGGFAPQTTQFLGCFHAFAPQEFFAKGIVDKTTATANRHQTHKISPHIVIEHDIHPGHVSTLPFYRE